MDLTDLPAKCDQAISDQDENELRELIAYLENELKGDLTAPARTSLYYHLGNLHSGLSQAVGEKASGWRNDLFPKHLAEAINCYRQALEIARECDFKFIHEIETNLANELANQRRNIEAQAYWFIDFTVAGDASFVSSLRRAKELLWSAHWLNDPGHAERYVYEAYRLLKLIRNNLTPETHPAVSHSMQNDQEILNLLTFGDEHFGDLENWDAEIQEDEYQPDERAYRKWCRENRLFVNPLNDISVCPVTDQDILQFPEHATGIFNGPYLNAAFSALKREYCFARFMMYEGMHCIHPSFEERKLFLTDTLDYVQYGGSTEKIKTAFRLALSVLDSLANLMNSYFACNSKRSAIKFSPSWIKTYLSKEDNHFIDALYWLSCDLTENTSEKFAVPNPAASVLKRIRNEMEHGWLRVAEFDPAIWHKQSDFAMIMSSGELIQKTLFTLHLVRSAMLYFCMAIKYHEAKKPTDGKLIVRTPTPVFEDDLFDIT